MQSELSEIPISTDNPDFIEKVELKLRKGEPVVILLRYCHQGGNRAYFLVKTIDGFYQVLEKASYRDSISVFFSQAFPVQGEVDSELRENTVKFLEKVIQDDDDTICLIRLDTKNTELDLDSMKVFTNPDQINEWFSQNTGIPVIVGTLAFWEDNSDENITAYVRDYDGQIRPGAY
ncbi:MAG: hypothetical protein DPW18_17865 [Chloroflexi bacterium]|nr:hypothetical protein [Chloroflexi bacterium CFX2]MCQ3938889.1 hypothetical protein [Chloroflexota bacterium]MDL1943579.1 hypothetical protein [Chloroflexi bacterium CFX2]